MNHVDLRRLLADCPDLPPGRVVGADEVPAMWVGDAAPAPGLWETLHRAHPRTGLWPLLLAPLDRSADFRPWLSGELSPPAVTDPARHDPHELLRTWWDGLGPEEGEDEDDGEDEEEELGAVLAPFGRTWPGAAPSTPVPAADADECARIRASVLESAPNLRIGLVAAPGGAAALAACGWTGPANHAGTGRIAAVLADWEHRFGIRVVRAGFDTLELSVPNPPTTREAALRVAAEHVALCPDQVFQGTGSLTAYADLLVGSHEWMFWWD
ncbi:DUF4253 domain-containing protein [Kitasatospora sp. NPDC059722]|uniref:DUF4253 domain-containing protein n=1 Tax=Kitasatospora sp. NPDC059722 TaxID=3346925 RepID=UPI003696AADB